VAKSRTTPLETEPTPQRGVQQFLRELGPGLITGAADDDPSGISTYSVAGASYGYATLWTALLSFPLMAAVQLMCARLGMVTGCGLASVIRTRYPRWVLWFACGLVIVANVFNIGADLGGMADAMQMITGIPAYCWTPFFAALITGLLFWTSYRTIARVFKWLTLVLFAYVITAFLARPDWAAIVRATFIPHHWNGHARCAGSGGFLRVCDRGRGKVEIGLSERKATTGTQILRCDCDSHTHWARI
jgi:NRAMP (natural resistance-associated macrophage protein)-like metal ion transporter